MFNSVSVKQIIVKFQSFPGLVHFGHLPVNNVWFCKQTCHWLWKTLLPSL